MKTQTELAKAITKQCQGLSEKVTIQPIKERDYKCDRCGHVTKQKTNHTGKTWSFNHWNTCPNCPPFAKYPEFGGQTHWTCLEA